MKRILVCCLLMCLVLSACTQEPNQFSNLERQLQSDGTVLKNITATPSPTPTEVPTITSEPTQAVSGNDTLQDAGNIEKLSDTGVRPMNVRGNAVRYGANLLIPMPENDVFTVVSSSSHTEGSRLICEYEIIGLKDEIIMVLTRAVDVGSKYIAVNQTVGLTSTIFAVVHKGERQTLVMTVEAPADAQQKNWFIGNFIYKVGIEGTEMEQKGIANGYHEYDSFELIPKKIKVRSKDVSVYDAKLTLKEPAACDSIYFCMMKGRTDSIVIFQFRAGEKTALLSEADKEYVKLYFTVKDFEGIEEALNMIPQTFSKKDKVVIVGYPASTLTTVASQTFGYTYTLIAQPGYDLSKIATDSLDIVKATSVKGKEINRSDSSIVKVINTQEYFLYDYFGYDKLDNGVPYTLLPQTIYVENIAKRVCDLPESTFYTAETQEVLAENGICLTKYVLHGNKNGIINFNISSNDGLEQSQINNVQVRSGEDTYVFICTDSASTITVTEKEIRDKDVTILSKDVTNKFERISEPSVTFDKTGAEIESNGFTIKAKEGELYEGLIPICLAYKDKVWIGVSYGKQNENVKKYSFTLQGAFNVTKTIVDSATDVKLVFAYSNITDWGEVVKTRFEEIFFL